MTWFNVWGHRGCRGKDNPPENSLAAFKEAIRQGVTGIELDVFLTTDKHLVVFHDDDLRRMTNGQGPIQAFTLQALERFRLKNFSGNLTEERIPTLDQVLDLVDDWRDKSNLAPEEKIRADKFVVNIETKGAGIAKYVAKAIETRLIRGWRPDNFLNSSFDMASLREMRHSLPSVPVGTLFEGPLEKPSEPWDVTLLELKECLTATRDIRPDTVNITYPSLTRAGALQLIKDFGARPVAWTSGEKDPHTLRPEDRLRMAKFLTENSITMITDYPEQILQILREG